MELKSIALYLPVMGAVLWAIAYAVNARNYEEITVPTGLIAHGLAIVTAGFLTHWILKTPIDFTPFFAHPEKFWFWLAPAAVVFASMFLHLSLKMNSASYTGLAEMLYVIFIPIFAYLFFGHKELNLSMLIGGALMLVGVGFVFYGQWQKSL
jgi:drug/metabolite transporter (DMT)-like permease